MICVNDNHVNRAKFEVTCSKMIPSKPKQTEPDIAARQPKQAVHHLMACIHDKLPSTNRFHIWAQLQ